MDKLVPNLYVKKGVAKCKFKVMATWKNNPMFRWNNSNEGTNVEFIKKSYMVWI
jgi:hypothetical protein